MTQAPAHTRTRQFTPVFISRNAGLSLDALAGLESPRATAWAAAMLSNETWLRTDADMLGSELERIIGNNNDRENRRLLLALRRDIHNLRPPRGFERALEAVQVHSADLCERTRTWADACVGYRAVLARGEQHLSSDQECSRAYLRQLASLPALRCALALAAPALADQLDEFIGSPVAPKPTKRVRKQELALLRYVYRTACKTSPFSTFTSVALGRFVLDGDRLMTAQGEAGTTAGCSRLNVALIPRIIRALRTNPRYAPDLPVELVTGWEIHSQRLRYLRRHRVSGSDSSQGVDTMQESVFYLSTGEVLTRLVKILGARPGITIRELTHDLHAALGLAATSDDIDRFLASVVRLDLVSTPQLVVELHADDPFQVFADGLDQIGAAWATSLASRVRDASMRAREVAVTAAAERGPMLADLRSRLTTVLADVAGADEKLPDTLVYEDVATRCLHVTASAPKWDQVAVDLERVASILPVFDALRPQRHLLEGFFAIRFGAGGVCRDLVKFVQDFHLDIFDEYLKAIGRQRTELDGTPSPPPNWLDLDAVDQLYQARLELVRGMREAWAAMEPHDTELVLPAEFFDRVAAHVPRERSEFDPRSFFVQVVEGPEPRVVLNQTYTGLTLLFSRFLYCLDAVASSEAGSVVAELRRNLAQLQPEGAVFAEITGGVDTTNLNLHPAVTAYELVCPGESSTRSPAEQLQVADIEIRHDPSSDSLYLYSTTLRRRVIPVYLGFLVPFALSDIQRVLLLFSLTRMARLDLWSGTNQPLAGRPISSYPRVRAGSVVLVRKTWKSDPSRLPRRRSYDTAAEWYLAWQRFRRDHGLPQHVFATASMGESAPEADEPGRREPDAPGALNRRSTKPQYVDLASASCLDVLDDMIHDSPHRLVFTEMLPGPGEQWLRTPDGPVVTEQTIELTLLPSEVP